MSQCFWESFRKDLKKSIADTFPKDWQRKIRTNVYIVFSFNAYVFDEDGNKEYPLRTENQKKRGTGNPKGGDDVKRFTYHRIEELQKTFPQFIATAKGYYEINKKTYGEQICSGPIGCGCSGFDEHEHSNKRCQIDIRLCPLVLRCKNAQLTLCMHMTRLGLPKDVRKMVALLVWETKNDAVWITPE